MYSIPGVDPLNPELSFSGRMVQYKYYQTGSLATGTTQLPLDNTIPQITEGDQYMSLNFQPIKVGNILEHTIIFNGASGDGQVTLGYFDSSSTSAIAASSDTRGASQYNTIVISFKQIVTSLDSKTFSVRAGPNSATAVTFNGASGVGYFGGTIASSIMIKEYQP